MYVPIVDFVYRIVGMFGGVNVWRIGQKKYLVNR